jgi:hypothetical protein
MKSKLTILALMVAVIAAHPGNVGLQWFANPEPIVAGYKVFVGTAPRTYSYSNTLNGISTTNITFFSMTNGVQWYFAVTAFATNGLESDYSEELTLDWRGPSAPKGFKIKSVTLTLETNP